MSHMGSSSGRETDELFFAKIQDLFDTCERKSVPKFTSFLDEGQVFAAEQYLLRSPFRNWMLWGGIETAKRKMLGVFPDYMEPAAEAFPIAPVSFTYRKADELTHRDFLGSLMALQLKREAIGDILVSEGGSVLFLTDKVAPLVLEELFKVGRVGVKSEPGITVPVSLEEKFQEIGGTVASLRLDSVVALLIGKSREKACGLIQSGFVSVNYRETENNSLSVHAGDILTVRGFGKAKVSDDIRETKKGRFFVSLLKYI